jgi:tetratricopeptide (TPR) repeat protein
VEEALALYENALRLRIEAGDAAGQANTFNNIGDVYWALDDYDNAIANYGAALRLIRDDETAFENYLRAVDGLVEAHNSVGRYLRSQELLETRLNRVRQRNNRREEMKTLQAFAELYLMAEQPREAVRFYQGALAIAQQIEDIRAESRLANTLSRLLDRLQGVES